MERHAKFLFNQHIELCSILLYSSFFAIILVFHEPDVVSLYSFSCYFYLLNLGKYPSDEISDSCQQVTLRGEMMYLETWNAVIFLATPVSVCLSFGYHFIAITEC